MAVKKTIKQSGRKKTPIKQATRAEKPKAIEAKPKEVNLTAKQKALKNREKIFASASDIYATPNYIAVVDRNGTSYYKKNDENRAIANKVTCGKLCFGKRGSRGKKN